MGQTLTNGVYLPDEGERNCYTGLARNWRAVDNHLGDANIHVTYADKQTWNNHVADSVKHVTAADKEAWNGKADASALTAHTGNTTIHVTAAEKETWNGKADASALTAHTGDTTIHVTAEDKSKWDAVTSKADDSDVVHKSGDETISGNKTFSSINGVKPSSLSLPRSKDSRIDISSYFTDTSNGAVNRYTVPSNGFVYLAVADVVTIHIFSQDLGRITNYGDTRGRATAGLLYAFLPVRKDDIFTSQWYTTLTNVSLTSAYFIPCQGNV